MLRWSTSIGLAALLLWPLGAARADGEPGTLLVLPIFGAAPPELEVPWAERLAESLKLELATGVEVVAQEPTAALAPGAIEPTARQRAHELGAAAVLWGELIAAGDCPAPRRIRLRILDPTNEQLVVREVCPSATDIDALSRAIALAVANALRAGEVASLPIPAAAPARRPRPRRRPIPPAPRDGELRRPCPKCPPRPAPRPLPPTRTERSWPQWTLAVGGLYSSHPSWSAASLGLGVGLGYRPLAWLDIGLELQALRGRRVAVDEVQALYTAWPLVLHLALDWRARGWSLGAELGLKLSWSRLDVLLERLQETKSVERLNPAVLLRARFRYWTPWGIGFALYVGPAVYLRRQRYTYGGTDQLSTVLSMQEVSLEAGLSLLVALDR
jgi:hypothetical protein